MTTFYLFFLVPRSLEVIHVSMLDKCSATELYPSFFFAVVLFSEIGSLYIVCTGLKLNI